MSFGELLAVVLVYGTPLGVSLVVGYRVSRLLPQRILGALASGLAALAAYTLFIAALAIIIDVTTEDTGDFPQWFYVASILVLASLPLFLAGTVVGWFGAKRSHRSLLDPPRN